MATVALAHGGGAAALPEEAKTTPTTGMITPITGMIIRTTVIMTTTLPDNPL